MYRPPCPARLAARPCGASEAEPEAARRSSIWTKNTNWVSLGVSPRANEQIECRERTLCTTMNTTQCPRQTPFPDGIHTYDGPFSTENARPRHCAISPQVFVDQHPYPPTCAISKSQQTRLSIGGLGGATGTAAGHATAATALATEVAAATLGAGATTIEASAASAAGHVASTTRVVAGATIGTGLGPSGLDRDALAVDDMRVGSDGRLVSGGRAELDESAAL